MRVGLDATPLLGPRSGVGRYVAGLVPALAGLPDAPELVLTTFTLRGRGALHPPAGAAVRSRPVPARLLRLGWERLGAPPAEWLCGPVDVMHGTNFVVPPTRRAARVVTVHDLAPELHPDTVAPATLRARVLVRRAVAEAAAVLTVTAATAADLVAYYGVDSERVCVTPLGVDPAWFDASPPAPALAERLGLPGRYLLFVGTREPRKNLPVLLAAHAALSAADPATPPLVLAGPAGWGPDVLATAARGRSVPLGYLDDDELRRVVAGAACLVLPSQYEGFGLPALEALACGVPVVASDLPALREVCGPHARYAPVGDVDGLAAAVAEALADGGGPAAAADRRAHARTWTWRRCAEATVAAYAAAVRRQGSGGPA